MSSLLFFFYETTLLLCYVGLKGTHPRWDGLNKGESPKISASDFQKTDSTFSSSYEQQQQLLLLLQRVCLQDKVPSLRCVGLREVGGRSSARSSRMRIMSIVLDCDCQYPPPASHNEHLNLKLIASTISLYYCRALLLPADRGRLKRRSIRRFVITEKAPTRAFS